MGNWIDLRKEVLTPKSGAFVAGNFSNILAQNTRAAEDV